MHIKQIAGFLIVGIIVIAVLGGLSAVAIPHVGQMIAQDEAEDRTIELYKIQTAVTEMLYQSICGALEPIGPTSDMSQVCTKDSCPLVLSDYLVGVALDAGCLYSFTADGTVVQVVP